MRAFLAALFLLHSALSSWAQCLVAQRTTLGLSPCSALNHSQSSSFSEPFVNLSSRGMDGINSSTKLEGTVKELDLSCNCLQSLPLDFLSQAHSLERLYLQHNKLQCLAREFFENVSSLKHLSLQGNPLSLVPTSAFHPSLLHLEVDCRCDVLGSVLNYCTCSSSANCTRRSCECYLLQERGVFNATEFYVQKCSPTSMWLSLTIAGSVLAVLLAGGLCVAVFLVRRKRKASTIHSKRESTTSITHSQPRYISRDATPATKQGTCQARDYENVFIGHAQPLPAGQYECLERKAPQYRPQQPEDEECYMESEACPSDQLIYANTQQPYYSSGSGSSSFPPHDTEDVYILPDK